MDEAIYLTKLVDTAGLRHYGDLSGQDDRGPAGEAPNGDPSPRRRMQGLAYGMPAFKAGGQTVAGFAAFKGHLDYMPNSGSVLVALGDEVAGFETSKGHSSSRSTCRCPSQALGPRVDRRTTLRLGGRACREFS